MDREAHLLQGAQQTLQTVGEQDGGGGVSQQQGGADEHQDTQHHEEGLPQAFLGDLQKAQAPQHVAVGVEEVQNGRTDHNEDHRFHALDENLGLDLGDGDEHQQGGQHQTVGHQILA